MFTDTITSSITELITNNISKTIVVNRPSSWSFSKIYYSSGAPCGLSKTETFNISMPYGSLIKKINLDLYGDNLVIVYVNGLEIGYNLNGFLNGNSYITLNNPFRTGNNTITIFTQNAPTIRGDSQTCGLSDDVMRSNVNIIFNY